MNPRGVSCSFSKPVFVTRIISPVCTPAVCSFVMTLGYTTRHMFSSSVILGSGPAMRLFDPMMGCQ